MLRLGQKAASRLQNEVQANWIRSGRRTLSDSQTSAGLTRSIIVGGGLFACACGGTVAYAKVSPDFRKNVEKNAPPIATVFDMVLGPSRTEIKDKIPSDAFKSKIKTKSVDPLKAPLKDSRKVLETTEPSNAVEATTPPNVPAPEITAPTPAEQQGEENQSLLIQNMQNNEKLPSDEAKPADQEENQVSDVKPTQIEEVTTQKEQQSSNIQTSNVETEKNDQQQISLKTEERILQQEVEEIADAAATSAILDDLLNACSIACSNAILLNVNAANAIALHSSILRTANDDFAASATEKSLQWEDVAHARDDMNKAQIEAEASFRNAIEELAKIKHVLQETNCENNHDLGQRVVDIGRDCMNMSHDLEEAKARVQGKVLEADVLKRYLEDIEKMKEKFQNEFESSLPTISTEPEWKRTGKRVSQDEENAMLLHMQHRVEELQRELSEERTLGAERLDEVVSSVRAEVEDHVKKLAELDLHKRLEEQRLNHEEQVTELQRTHDDDIRRQLKRQASAHVEHMSEALSYMERQAAEKYEKLVETTMEEQKSEFLVMMEAERAANEAKTASIIDKHQLELEMAIARVRGIEQAVDGRAHVENVTRKAQELSLACDALLHTIKYGDKGKPVPLATELTTVKKVYDDNNALNVFSAAVPTEAVERGVYTEEILRASFRRIGKICRRVSLVDQNRNSLFVYFLSYLKSLLTVSSAQLAPPTEIDQSALDVFTIISYSNYCLDHGNLEQAARFVNQLTGEPRRVVEGWLKEARLLLETRQAVEALATVSKGLVIGAQLEK
uniref:MICOS complex subunit MIC60 n=1 Tax=Phallusia mammillata TaxID=59560 RepID=A0A6F9DFD2_9ASCI|nr:MICOS complex subunit MIC60-like [Phallusia mammillata]